ncbi:MAG: efflux RND transporter periplasmic adaptor subunit [Pseudomonadota bacterium]
MSKKNIFMVVAVLVVSAGLFSWWNTSQDSPGASGGSFDREILYWVAPMDPNYRRDEPGKSPMGMDLVPVYADDVDSQAGVVKIDPTVVSTLGVRTELAARSSLPRQIDTVGYVSYDEDTVQHVHTRVEGWIEVLAKKATGDRVQKGELLFELYSPNLVNAQEEYLAALRSGNAALLRASRGRLQALGFSDRQIARLERDRQAERRVPVYAEMDGVIAHLGVREGIFVTPMVEVMSVARLDSVWVVAEVLERQATWVSPGQEAFVKLEYLPGTELEGVVDYIYPELDSVTRTLKVRLRFENPDENLRPNMFATVTINGRNTGDIVHVPRQAIIRGAGSNRVVVDLGEGRFESRPVLVGVESGDRVAIRRGLQEGERIVTSAQFLIDSESNVASALERMNSRDAK